MFGILKKLFQFAGEYGQGLKKAIWFHIFYSIFEALPIAGILYSLSAIVDHLQSGATLPAGVIVSVSVIMLLSVAGRIVFHYLANKESSTACFSMCAQQRMDIGERLKRMPMGYFNANSIGDITSSVTTTMSEIESMAGAAITNIVVGIVHAAVLTFMIALFHWKIGLISFVAILLGIWLNTVIQKKSMEIAPDKQQIQATLASAVLEYVQGISVIKAYGLGEQANRTVDHAIAESHSQNLRFERVFARLTALYSYLFKVAACGVIGMACYLFAGGNLSLSSALTILISSFVMYTYIEGVGGTASLLELIHHNLTRIEEIKSAPVLDENGADLCPRHFGIEFKDVCFSYATRSILEHVNLRIPENTTTAIVGPSGGGKSTLCNLIARFWDVNSGEVLLGGENVKNYTSDSLLRNISMVFQKVYLFRATIADNIRFGKPDAPMEEVVEIAKKACCHDFIAALPDGYNTLVREGGGSLSGGEKQRISIARAMLKDAPIIILDEATSSVDPENELLLQTAIAELTRHKTVIMIAHRLSTVRNADQIVVLEDGKIAEFGKHEDLIKNNGLYKEFLQVRKQAVGWSLDKQD
jgi:ATP-binding cassette subfamily B protein IrtB